MSERLRLINDPHIGGLKRRSELALEWFDAIAKVLRADLEDFNSQQAMTPAASFAYAALEVQLSEDAPVAENGVRNEQPCALTLSTKFSKVMLVVNDPPGWLCMEVSKKSSIFDGILHRGAIEVALVPRGTVRSELHYVECDWLSPDGADFPKASDAIADKLWDVLFLPHIRHQLAAAQKSHGR
jgi:hypothetical protein